MRHVCMQLEIDCCRDMHLSNQSEVRLEIELHF